MARSSGKGKRQKKKTDSAQRGADIKPGLLKIESRQNFKGWVEAVCLLMILAAVAMLLLIGPFERGFFFPRELLSAKIAIFCLLVIWGVFRLFRYEKRLVDSPLDICMLALFLAYFLSFFVAANQRTALTEMLKIASYLVIYFAVVDLSRYWHLVRDKFLPAGEDDPATGQGSLHVQQEIPPGISLILHLVLFTAVVVTMASLAAAAGNLDFAGGYAANRIASPLGYANTAAAYLMAAYLMNLGLIPLARKRIRALYFMPAALMLMTVVLTFSRGAWLLLPPLALLFIAISPAGERLRAFLNLLVTASIAVPFAFLIDPFFRAGNALVAWLIIIAVSLFAFLLGLAVDLYLNQDRRIQLSLAAVAGIVILALAVIIVVVPVLSPLTLQRTAEDSSGSEIFEQVISTVEPNNEYTLQFEVRATGLESSSSEMAYNTWAVTVLEGIPGYRNVERINFQGGSTDGWLQKNLTFTTGDSPTRIIVRLHNSKPDTEVTFKAVRLVSDRDEKGLSFAYNRILPERVYDRLYSYSRDRNMDLRFEFFRDALRIIRDYPILGTGGGGWAAVYRSYQDFPYNSRAVHNHFLEVWVESGIIGFLAFIGIWISLFISFIRNCLREKVSSVTWQYWTAVLIPVIALGAHSVIDWNFSIAAVGIYLFTMIGAARSLDQRPMFNKKTRGKRGNQQNSLAGRSCCNINRCNSNHLNCNVVKWIKFNSAIPGIPKQRQSQAGCPGDGKSN